MPTALEITNTVQDGVIKAVETSQRWTLGTVRKTAEAFDGFLPEAPKLPLVDRLPTPKQALDAGFNFAERLLAAQRSFVTEVASLTSKTPPVIVTPAKKASA
jgi:hypothetical protein